MFQQKFPQQRNNSEVFLSTVLQNSPNISNFFLKKGERGRCYPRKKTHWCLGQNKTPRLVSAGLLQVLACLKNEDLFIAWWALGTFPELTLEPLKAPQYKSGFVPQVVLGVSETELQASGIQLAAAGLGDVGDSLEEQVGAVLSLAVSEGSGWLQQSNCSFHNAFFTFRLWLITRYLSFLILVCLSVC